MLCSLSAPNRLVSETSNLKFSLSLIRSLRVFFLHDFFGTVYVTELNNELILRQYYGLHIKIKENKS
jgi:hypothetical protein